MSNAPPTRSEAQYLMGETVKLFEIMERDCPITYVEVRWQTSEGGHGVASVGTKRRTRPTNRHQEDHQA